MEQFVDEIWKPCTVNPVYMVSNYGRVKTIDHKIWCKKNNSYSLCFSVHRLVATAFIPNPNNLPQINHIDGNKDNNHVSNLEWCDNGYNQRHAMEHGLKSRAKMSLNCHLRKLTLEQVAYIKAEWEKVDKTICGNKEKFNKDMAMKFNLKSINTIRWITKGVTNKYTNQDIVQTTNTKSSNENCSGKEITKTS